MIEALRDLADVLDDLGLQGRGSSTLGDSRQYTADMARDLARIQPANDNGGSDA